MTNGKGAVLNNKLYFGSEDHNVYEYDPITGQQKVIFKSGCQVLSSGVVLNNKLYIGSGGHNVYEYDFNILNLNLSQIKNNSNNVILNELNYLNPELNVLQLKIVDKTDILAIIKTNNNNNYFDKVIVNYKINNNNEISNINLNELIKKSIFFKIKENNKNYDLHLNKVDTNNLNFGNVEITRNKNLRLGANFKNICFDKKERRNNSSIIKIFIIPKCEYNQKSNFIFQIIKGINKNGQDNTKNGWILNMDDENKLVYFVNINYRYEKITHTLSNNFDLSNANKQEQEMILYQFNEPEDETELAHHEKATILYCVRERKYESILNLKQKINGNITATVIKNYEENQTFTISIKEAMQILQKYGLLPDEIIINEDNSITFNGKAFISLIRYDKPKLILNTEII